MTYEVSAPPVSWSRFSPAARRAVPSARPGPCPSTPKSCYFMNAGHLEGGAPGRILSPQISEAGTSRFRRRDQLCADTRAPTFRLASTVGVGRGIGDEQGARLLAGTPSSEVVARLGSERATRSRGFRSRRPIGVAEQEG
jgi:hypothetical protein